MHPKYSRYIIHTKYLRKTLQSLTNKIRTANINAITYDNINIEENLCGNTMKIPCFISWAVSNDIGKSTRQTGV